MKLYNFIRETAKEIDYIKPTQIQKEPEYKDDGEGVYRVIINQCNRIITNYKLIHPMKPSIKFIGWSKGKKLYTPMYELYITTDSKANAQIIAKEQISNWRERKKRLQLNTSGQYIEITDEVYNKQIAEKRRIAMEKQKRARELKKTELDKKKEELKHKKFDAKKERIKKEMGIYV